MRGTRWYVVQARLMLQVRVLLYVTALTSGIMESMAHLEHAVVDLLYASSAEAADDDSSTARTGHQSLAHNQIPTYGEPTAAAMEGPAGD